MIQQKKLSIIFLIKRLSVFGWGQISNFKKVRKYTFLILLFPINFYAQTLYNLGGVLEYKYVEGNNYDYITGAPKPSSKSFLELQAKVWNLNNRNTAKYPILTNLPKAYSDRFIFFPEYFYDFNERGRPLGRGVRSWVSKYAGFTEHNPADWKKSSYNWPYGGNSLSARWWNYPNFIILDATEATWKYGKKSYSSYGSIESALYQYTWSSTSDYFREELNASTGSIPGRNDPNQEFFIPDDFWSNHQYAHIQVITESTQDTNPYMDVNFKSKTNITSGLLHTFDTFIFPYRLPSGEKKTLLNNSPEIYYFGQQGAYSGSEATFLSFAQDLEGDELFYRWVDGTNLFERPEFARYEPHNQELRYEYKAGYSADKPLKSNTTAEDYFYINPYSGTVNFTNSTDTGFKRSFVAIDQYKEGQLISTIVNQVSFISQSVSSSNNRPVISIDSETDDIAQKTSFDFDTDISLSSNAISPPAEIKPYIPESVTRTRVPYKEVNNNGEILLEGLDAGENKEVSFDISVSDPNGDNITFAILPVDSDLIDTYPWTLTDNGDNTYKFDWTTPADLDTETTLYSKSYMFMLYAKDDNEVLSGLPGRTLKPVSITVHKRPSVIITSTDVATGDITNDNSINLTVTLSDIDTSELDESSFTLTTDLFELTNATLTDLTKINNFSYTATLSVASDLDPTISSVSTSIKIDEDKFSISKTGGHKMNQVSVPNLASNLFEWTSDQVRPQVTYDFFDSKGNSLTENYKTNDSFIVAKVSTSRPVDDFDSADITFRNTNVSSSEFQKTEAVEETYYTVKINSTENNEGEVNFSIPENVFSDALGNQNQEGVLSVNNTTTNFIWQFDRLKPILTITNPFEGSGTATTATSGEFTFSFNEPVSFKNKELPDLTDPEKEDLIGVLNSNITNAFFSDFVFDSSNPNQFKLTINHGGGSKTVTLNVPEDFAQDLYGNNLSDETNSSHSYNLDFPRLSNIYTLNRTSRSSGPSIYSRGDELSYLTTTDPVNILIAFLGQAQNQTTNKIDVGYQGQKSGSNFTIGDTDIGVSSGMLSNLEYFGLGSIDDSGNAEQLFKATFTPDSNFNGYVSFSIEAAEFSNAAGAANIYSKRQILLDTSPPSIAFNVATPFNTPLNRGDITNEDFLLVTARFSEPVNDFTISDLINGNSFSHKFPVVSDFVKIDEKTYSFRVAHTSGDGEYSFADEIKSYADKQGLKNNTQSIFNWYFDTTGPTAEIEIYNGNNAIKDLEYSANNSATVKYIFSEPGISLTDSGLELYQLLNLYLDNITLTEANFDSTNRIITATGSISSVGQVEIELPENLFQDRGGNKNSAATERVFYYDNSVPEPTISISDSGSIINNSSTINSLSLNVSYDFSVELGASNYSDFTLSELQEILSSQISNGSLTNLQKVDQNTFTGTISGYSTGEIVVGFPEDLVFTDSNVNNTKANNVALYFDDIAPSATLILSTADNESLATGTKTNQSTVNAKVYVSEPTSDLTLDDFSIQGDATAANFQKEDDYTYSFDLTTTTQISSAVSVSLNANSFSDSVGNFNTETIQSSYDFDDIRPIPSISSSLVSDGANTNFTVVPLEITFSEDTFFTQSEDRLESYLSTLIVNGTLSDFSKDGNTIRFNINRVSNGTTTIALPENIFNDSHSNGNTEASFDFEFQGSIALTEVKLSSNNPLEEDSTVSTVSRSPNFTITVPGTRSLLNNGEIDFLYVNDTQEITLSITSEADINITGIIIDGVTVPATNLNGNQTQWEAVYSLSNATTEGIIDFQIEFTDTNGTAQAPVNKTTDGINYKKDFTSPVLTTKIFLGNNEVDYRIEPLVRTQHKIVLTANEPLFSEKAYANVNDFQYTGDLARFAAWVQYNSRFGLNGYHNSGMLDQRLSSTLPLEFNYNYYFNQTRSTFSTRELTDDNLILFPTAGSGSYTLTVPNNYFQDLAGNKTIGYTITGLKLLQSSSSGYVVADIVKKACDYVTKASVKRKLNHSYSYNIADTEFFIELSSNQDFSTSETLVIGRVRETNSQIISGDETYNSYQEFQKDFEIDLEESAWVRFKVFDYLTPDRSSNPDITFTNYSEPVYITVNPITTEISGPVGVCGLNQTETFTINTTGGTWSVSDNTVASISSTTGELTTLSAGATEVIYTTPEGCIYSKKLEIFDSPTVSITANGQTTFCEGTSIQISSSITDTNKIIWYKDDILQTHLTSNTVNLNSTADSGVYHMGYVTPCGTSISNKITIKVNGLPTATKIKTNE